MGVWYMGRGILLLAPGLLWAAAPVGFNRDVQPILADTCFHCHGPDKNARKAGLRLDSPEGARQEHHGMAAVLPGHPEKSAMITRIFSDDPKQIMPPPTHPRKLTRPEKETLRAWIAQGAKYEPHWAYLAPVRPEFPAVTNAAWPRNGIDRFALARMESEGLAPSPGAEKYTLIRRATFDLTGLPPTLEEVDAFLADPATNAFEKVVDRLLQSPAYGERWCWDWLDAARYADSNGFQGDPDRTMWPWRDWVTRQLNANQPYDQFIVEQLAGDLLTNATPDQVLASAFNRNHMYNGEGGRIPEETRVENVFDRTETVGTVFMGLTVGCARCHDHKFDPLTQREYYQLFAYFNQTSENGNNGNGQIAPTRAFATPDPNVSPLVMIMDELPKPRDTFILTKGAYDKHEEKVFAGVPAALPPLPPGAPTNRLALARWLVAPGQPLTARVAVNRFWQSFFGIGLVKTAEDFGLQGERPRQQALLDWLATEFVRTGWDVKALHKLIVMSATYGQSSKVKPEQWERDPENRLLARGPRFRLPAWMIHDEALAAGGLLVTTVGGAPVRPYQPAGIWEEATFGKTVYQQDHGDKLYRRMLYTFWRRIVGPTLLFDNAARQTCSVKPLRTDTPLHALTTLNDATYVEAARALAERVMTAAPTDDARIELAFRRATARRPTAEELAILRGRLDALKKTYAADPDAAAQLLKVGESKRNESLPAADHAAFTQLCSLVLNLDETITKE